MSRGPARSGVQTAAAVARGHADGFVQPSSAMPEVVAPSAHGTTLEARATGAGRAGPRKPHRGDGASPPPQSTHDPLAREGPAAQARSPYAGPRGGDRIPPRRAGGHLTTRNPGDWWRARRGSGRATDCRAAFAPPLAQEREYALRSAVRLGEH